MRTKVIEGLGWSAGRTVASVLIQFFTIVVISRLLTPGEVGTVAVAFGIISTLLYISQLGVHQAFIQRQEIAPHHVGSALLVSGIVGSVFFAVLCGASGVLADMLNAPEIRYILPALSLMILMQIFNGLFEAFAKRDLEFRTIATVDFLSAALGYSAVSIGCALAGIGLWSLVAGYLCGCVLRMVLLGRHYAARLTFRASRQATRDLLGYGILTSIAGLVDKASADLDRVLVGAFLGTSVAGLYVRSTQAVQIASLIVTQPFGQVLFPAMARVQDQKNKLLAAHKTMQTLLSLSTLPGALILALTSDPIIPLLLGENWAGAVDPVRILSIMLFLRSHSAATSLLLMAIGRVRERIFVETAHLALVLLAITILYQWGLVWVCMGVAAVMALRSVVYAVVVKGVLQQSVGEIFKVLIPGILVTVFLGGLYLICMAMFGDWMNTVWGAAMYITASAGLMAYLVFFASWKSLPEELAEVRAVYLGRRFNPERS